MTVTLANIHDGMCRWPMYDEPRRGEDAIFCGEPCEFGRSFCPAHFAVAYQTQKPLPRAEG